jgi:hypothetical protein
MGTKNPVLFIPAEAGRAISHANGPLSGTLWVPQ